MPTPPITRPFTVRADAWRRVAPHVSKEESRPVLNGVLVETTGIVCATNGATMGAFAHACPDAEDRPERDVIVSLDKAPPAKCGTITFHPSGIASFVSEGGSVEIGRATWHEIEGPFPSWRRVMPRELPALPGTSTNGRADFAPVALPAVAPGALSRFILAADTKIDDRRLLCFPDANPNRAITVRVWGVPEFVGLLMPCMTPDALPALTTVPAWARERREGDA